MVTISGILEGKTGNYFKLEDFGDDFAVILESIDPKKTEIRIEKVEQKIKAGEEKKRDLEYYHILCRSGDVEKDLSLTYTALRQFGAVMPHDENWKGYKFKYLGTKGAGKNIKYNFQILGKETGEQARLDVALTHDPMIASILSNLKQGERFFPDGLIPMDNVIQACQNVPATFQLLKDKGLILEVKTGFFKVV